MRKPPIILLLSVALTAGVPQAAGAYGAFAIDESAWAFAFSVLYPSQAEADQQAVSLCAEEGGEHCEIKYQFTGSRCAAAAVAEEQGLRAWGFGHADTRRGAIDNAMSYCKRENTSGGRCRKVAVSCGELGAPRAADANAYGAIAHSDHGYWRERGDFGISAGHPSQAEADRAAIKNCEGNRISTSEECRIIRRFPRCGAIAHPKLPRDSLDRLDQLNLNIQWATGVGDDQASAAKMAIDDCRSKEHPSFARFCRVRSWACVGNDGTTQLGGDYAAAARAYMGANEYGNNIKKTIATISVGQSSRALAGEMAMDECIQRGGGEECGVHSSDNGRCAVLVMGRDGVGWSAGFGDSKADALSWAAPACEDCQIKDWKCIDGDGADGAPQEEADAPRGDGAIQATDAPRDDVRRYGAFAIDVSAWAFAFSGGRPSQAEADEHAVSLCAQEGGASCEIKYQFTNRCAAVAVAEEQGLRAWGFGEAEGKAGAIDAAMSYCKRENASGGACHIEAASCGGDLADGAPQEEADAPRADGATQAADADSAFGAFAIDVSAWAFAFSGGRPSQAEADEHAVSLCAQEGGASCEIKYQFTNRCAAVAVAEEQGLRAWGFGEAEGKAGAIDAAMSYCKRENASGGACHIEAASCGERL